MVSLRHATCNVAFKEWSGVCEALIEGRQTVILRKGGISEGPGPGQFAPEHSEFWLYPTWTHQAEAALRHLGDEFDQSRTSGPNPDGSIPIPGLVRVGTVHYVSREEVLPALRQFHCLLDETVRQRFHYRKPGLWVLAARVWRRNPGFSLRPTREQAGCMTWVLLDEPLPTEGLYPVIDDAHWAEELRRIRAILASDAQST